MNHPIQPVELVRLYDEIAAQISDDPEVVVHEFKKLKKKFKKLSKKVGKPLKKVAAALSKNPLLQGLVAAIPVVGAGVVAASNLYANVKNIAAPIKAAVKSAKKALPQEIDQLINLKELRETRPNMNPVQLVRQQERVEQARQVTRKLEALEQMVEPALREIEEEEEEPTPVQQVIVRRRKAVAPKPRIVYVEEPEEAFEEMEEEEEVYEPEGESYEVEGPNPNVSFEYDPSLYYDTDEDEEDDSELEPLIIEALHDRDWLS